MMFSRLYDFSGTEAVGPHPRRTQKLQLVIQASTHGAHRQPRSYSGLDDWEEACGKNKV